MRWSDDAFPFVIAAFLLIAGAAALPPLTFTGDEPRYFLVAISVWLGEGLDLSSKAYSQWFLDNEGYALPWTIERGQHSIVHSVLLAPFAGLGGLSAARWAQVAMGLLSLLSFRVILRNLQLSNYLIILISILMISIPVLPYLKLLYSEIWLFCIVAWLLAVLSTPVFHARSLWIAVALCCALVFVHIRMVPIACGFGIFALVRAVSSHIDRRQLGFVSIALAAAIALWFWYQSVIAGAAGLTASAPFSPSSASVSDRLAVQLAGYRHGLLLHAPVYLLGVAGLVVGVRDRRPLAITAGAALVAYVLAFMWGTASESYTARFWVGAIPLLLLGILLWIDKATLRPLPWLAAFPVIAFSAAVTVAFFRNPDLLLINRFHSVMFDNWFSAGLPFNVALHAAWDSFQLGDIIMYERMNALPIIGIISAATIALVLAVAERTWISIVGAIGIWAVVGLVCSVSAMEEIKRGAKVTIVAAEDGSRELEVRFKKPRSVHGFRIKSVSDILMWGVPGRPKSFAFDVLDGEGNVINVGKASGRQINLLDIQNPIGGIRLRSVPASAEWPAERVRFFN